jgi:hypothetical protein
MRRRGPRTCAVATFVGSASPANANGKRTTNSLPFPGPSLSLDLAAVQPDEFLYEGQPDPQPALGALPRRVHLDEHVEDVGQVGGGIPTPVSRTVTTTLPTSSAGSLVVPVVASGGGGSSGPGTPVMSPL